MISASLTTNLLKRCDLLLDERRYSVLAVERSAEFVPSSLIGELKVIEQRGKVGLKQTIYVEKLGKIRR